MNKLNNVDKLNRNKKMSGLILGCAMLCVGLVACDGSGYDYEYQEAKHGSFKTQDEKNSFNKDKFNTVKTLNVDVENHYNFKVLKDKLTKKDREELDSEMLTTKEQYYHLVNLGKQLNLGKKYDYIFIVDDTDKFNRLYKDLIKDMSQKKGNILVYFPKDDVKNHVNHFTNSDKLTVIYKGDKLEKELNKLDVKYVPTLLALKDNKVKLTLTGYYDYNVIEDKMSVFYKK